MCQGILRFFLVLLSSPAGYVRLVGQELAPSKCVLVSTSRVVRKDIRDWVFTHEGDRWTVKLDVQDLGGHRDNNSALSVFTVVEGIPFV